MTAATESRQVRIELESTDQTFAAALQQQLCSIGDRVEISPCESEKTPGSAENLTHVVTFLSPPADEATSGEEAVRTMINRLYRLATLPVREGGTTLVIVQLPANDGPPQFQAGTPVADCAAAAFARSLHHERPDLRICVLDMQDEASPTDVAGRIVDRLDSIEPCSVIRFDTAGCPQQPVVRMQQPNAYRPRSHEWTSEDVILVTGGAKGITAACSLALAKQIGARFALLGRSAHPVQASESSQEIACTLQQFDELQVTARYYQCDVSNADEVQAVVDRIRNELGPITGVVHGAGVNRPRLAGTVTPDEAFEEIAPKLLGGWHLCRALDDFPPKLIVGLTSIIGITGMPGNAWYAFANEALAAILQRFSVAHQETSVQSIAFSVWGELGMGHRMNSVETLGRMGIGAIPTDEGVRRFVRLVTHDPRAEQVVVTAQLGGLDTWPMSPVRIPDGFRFVESIDHIQPGVELETSTRLTLERDAYLADHEFRGSHLFPTVFGLEAMAQAAAVVTGNLSPEISRIEQIRLERPIVVDPQHGTEIRIRALAEEQDEQNETAVCVEIHCAQTGFSTPHFSARLILGPRTGAPESERTIRDIPLEIDPQTDLYGSLLFQGPRFQRMGQILELDENHAVFRSDCRENDELSRAAFPSAPVPQTFLLGDPFLRDVLLQAGQLTIPQHVCLPTGIERLEFHTTGEVPPGPRIVVAPHKVRDGNEYRAAIHVTDDSGRILEQLEGYRLRILEERPEAPTAGELANPDERDTRMLQQLLDRAVDEIGGKAPAVAVAHLRSLHELPQSTRRRQEQPVIALAAQAWAERSGQRRPPADAEWLENGCPVFKESNDARAALSISHDDGCCVVCVGRHPQGCDVLAITPRTEDEWTGLLGEHRRTLLRELVADGDSLDEAGARIWAALEAIRKATQQPEVTLERGSRHDDRVLLSAATEGSQMGVLTFPALLTRGPRRMFAFVPETQTVPGNGREDDSDGAVDDSAGVPGRQTTADGGIETFCHSVDVANDGPAGQPVQQLRFVVSFQEASTISRHVPAAQYLKWMGRMRELVTSVNVPSLVELIAGGKWGLVTNWGDVHVHGELTANDVVQMRFWTDAARGSEVQFYCDFWRWRADGTWELAASAEQKATWVKLVGHGQVEAAPLPTEFACFIDRMGPRGVLKSPGRQLQRPLEHLDRGEPVFTAAAGPNASRKLLRQTFSTTLDESNLVGNIYFANYFSWQRKVRDAFVHTVNPAYHRGIGETGEMICLRSRMDYLREAMPFENVQVEMALQELTTRGGLFRFNFHAVHADGGRRKLAVGAHEVLWVVRDSVGQPIPQPWPEDIRSRMLQNGNSAHDSDAAGMSLSAITAAMPC